ncbi:Phosphate-selective porin O and P [Persephonella hydrogeniphila]|uniref:Phosphate-selective porin O and P n=1 Tax=Persephonella hydrogeniphila TaxID=198703 RepID=A0A285NB23_9AQUI|nr:hypothetical protein [Persephonella hydrogeniphila]SNZ06127.1 Phosphate-selective porin O and P [Persephonella hydrogeniphila]
MTRIFVIFISIFMFAYAEESIVFIPDFFYKYRDISDSRYEELSIPGFFHGENHRKESGFNLNYIEVKIEYPLPHRIELSSVLHITEDSTEIDELYIKKLSDFFSIKGGKFRSSIGIMNSKHQHDWFFTDPPLIYELLFSEHGLTEKGIGIEGKWNVVRGGVEILNGENKNSFGYDPIPEYNVDEVKKPSLYTFYLKTKFKRKRQVYYFGLSYLRGKRREKGEEILSGETKIYGFEWLFKFSDIKMQGEYFYRDIDGYSYTERGTVSKRQSGYYLQSIYEFTQKVSGGLRYDKLDKNKINGKNITGVLEKYSVCFNYFPVKEIKIRLGYSYNNSYRIENKKKRFNEFTLEMTIFLGKHIH